MRLTPGGQCTQQRPPHRRAHDGRRASGGRRITPQLVPIGAADGEGGDPATECLAVATLQPAESPREGTPLAEGHVAGRSRGRRPSARRYRTCGCTPVAREVIVHANAEPTGWELTIRDDGVGFDPRATRPGFGLPQQITAGLAAAGLRSVVGSQLGEGTCVVVRHDRPGVAPPAGVERASEVAP